MYNLSNFGLEDMKKCGKFLRQSAENCKNLEEASNLIVRHLYENLIDGDTGRKACSLVRFFKTQNFADLDKELKNFVRDSYKEISTSRNLKCLTLIASAGEKPEWNSRKTSSGHKAIPLISEDMVERSPMISNLIKQLGLEIRQLVQSRPDDLLITDEKEYGVFHVPTAVGSPYIPDQENFVIPCGIKSVLGFGGQFLKGDLFTVIIFSKVPISLKTANFFKTLALSVKFSVLPFENKVFAGQTFLPKI